MSDEIIRNKTWLQRNWIWFFLLVIIFILIISLSLNTNSRNGLIGTAKAYTEKELYQNAIKKANSNREILNYFGKIEALDELAILEGDASFSDDYNTAALSVRIKGEKLKGKLTIAAIKNGSEWEYKKIAVETKNPKKEILVLDTP